MFCVMSPFFINEPTRDLLLPYTKQSFQIMVGTLALQYSDVPCLQSNITVIILIGIKIIYMRLLYSQLPLKGHLVKADTSLRRTVGAGPERVRLRGRLYSWRKYFILEVRTVTPSCAFRCISPARLLFSGTVKENSPCSVARSSSRPAIPQNPQASINCPTTLCNVLETTVFLVI